MPRNDRQQLDVPQDTLADYCRRNEIRQLSLFGSVLHGEDRPDSDLDLLVEFEPGAVVGYLDMARMERELSDLLRRKVDLRTPAELSRHFRDDVLRESQVQYASAG